MTVLVGSTVLCTGHVQGGTPTREAYLAYTTREAYLAYTTRVYRAILHPGYTRLYCTQGIPGSTAPRVYQEVLHPGVYQGVHTAPRVYQGVHTAFSLLQTLRETSARRGSPPPKGRRETSARRGSPPP